MTQLELARKGITSSQMELVAQYEGLEAEFVRHGIEQGTIIIPANINHTNLTPRGIGQGLKTTDPRHCDSSEYNKQCKSFAYSALKKGIFTKIKEFV